MTIQQLFQKKWIGISVIVASVFMLFGLMSFAPKIQKKISEFGKNMRYGTVNVNLTQEQRRLFENDIKKLKKDIQTQEEGAKKAEPRSIAITYIQLAHTYENLGKLSQAISAYTSALKQDPKNVEALVGRADMKKELKEYGAAEADYRSAIEADTQKIDAYQKLADFYLYRKNDVDNARGVYMEGLLQTKDSSELKRHFAVFLESTGSKYEAYLYWSALAKANNTDTEAKAHADALRPSVQDVIRASEQAGNISPHSKKK